MQQNNNEEQAFAPPISIDNDFWLDNWLFIKYQLLTKPILALLVLPAFSVIMKWLIRSSGRTALSSGDYISFLLSPQGFALLAIGIVFIVVAIATDILAFVIIESTKRTRGYRPNARQTLIAAFKTLPLFLHPSVILLVAYIALVVPLSGVGISVGAFSQFKIPNFITDVIFRSPLYSTLYYVAIGVFIVLGVFLQFTFHIMLLEKVSPYVAMKRSFVFMRHNLWGYIKHILPPSLIVTITLIAIAALTYFGLTLVNGLNIEILARRFGLVLLLLIGAALLAFVTFLALPFFLKLTTQFFLQQYFHISKPSDVRNYDSLVLTYLPDEERAQATRPKTIMAGLTAGALLLSVGGAMIGAAFFDEIFRPKHHIAVVAHRGGGDLGPENTVAGLQAAIDQGVQWSEFDVQRTKDGGYVINHDKDFNRVAGVDKTPGDLTVSEATEIPVKDLFNPQKPSGSVATLDDYFKTAKGKIGLFIELKGVSADHQMVDDVAKMIKEYGVEDQAVILSLDYDIIQYAESTYPELLTGFLYFFSVGDSTNLVGDFLIMEEEEAKQDKIDEIRATGKKVVVWTVNKDESIEKFVQWDIDGLITDFPGKVQQGLQRQAGLTDLDLVLQAFSL
ncbi:glycerophosphodiester phosphodiesterase family protein [Stomatohabitans albus]|uniref:glycerophosphodiester phosphodiesterase family protein n=1 Tax=Stomatohabitans albus TaxID=3110766 RepID=UPI00300D0DAE